MNAPLILFLGKPGAGKGTQAELLAKKTGFSLFKTSGGLRSLATERAHVGEKIVSAMTQGDLVPYWLVMHLWLGDILSHKESEGIIIDGAVRRGEEAKLFSEVATWFERPYRVFFLDVTEEEMRSRIKKRATIENRTDDNEESLAQRMREYTEHTEPALTFFREQGTLITIPGEGSIEDVETRVQEAFTKELKNT